MGFPLLTYRDRSDNKLYRLQTPQSPLVRPRMYDHYDMDNYPIGTNAIVAVISYTGYDMEDAMVSSAPRAAPRRSPRDQMSCSPSTSQSQPRRCGWALDVGARMRPTHFHAALSRVGAGLLGISAFGAHVQ